ncbi:MAG: alpha-2-macroglobulin family protein, partial [Spirochaetes bacterium]|nr:alpha-2-macroglobulin family protein [Spirochaetota bacterium]
MMVKKSNKVKKETLISDLLFPFRKIMDIFLKLPIVLRLAIVIMPLIIIAYSGFIYYIGFGDTTYVADFLPKGESKTQSENIVIEFNEPVVPSDKLGKPVNPDLVTIKPALKCGISWESENTLSIRPSDKFKPGIKYKIVLKQSLVKEFGKSIIRSKKFSFHSPSFKVEYANIYSVFDASAYRTDKVKGEIKFNYPVSKSDVKENLSIIAEGAKDDQVMDVVIEEKEEKVIYSFVSSSLDYDKKPKSILIRLDKGLTSSLGGNGLKSDYESKVVLGKRTDRKVTDIRPIFEGDRTIVQMTFNMPIDGQAVERFIEFDPKIKVQINASDSVLSLKGAFKMGETYNVTVKAGLPGKDGSLIKKDQSYSVTIQDLPATIEFENVGRYLPKKGGMKIGFSAVNISQLSIQVLRLHKNNIVHYLNRGDYYFYRGDYFIHNVITTNITISAERNKKVNGYIDLSTIISAKYPGIYRIVIWEEYNYWDRKILSILSTDLGISVKSTVKDMLVFVNDLSTFDSVSGAKVSLVSGDNQVLLTGETRGDGFCLFKDVKEKIESAFGKDTENYQPFLLMVQKGDDFSYLKFDDAYINSSVFNVGGSPYSEGEMDAFLYTERGVYRPGEDLHITGIVRSENYSIPPSMPLTLKIYGPTGDEVKKLKGKLNNGGMLSFKVNIPAYEKTGAYSAVLLIGKDMSIGQCSFRVEDFMPNKIKVKLELKKKTFKADESLEYTVKGINLFGPPAVGSKVSTEVRFVDIAFRPKGYEGYIFEVPDRRMSDYHYRSSEEVLDQNGEYFFTVPVEYGVEPAGLLKAVIYAEVQEVGGRAVAVVDSVTINKNPFFLGIKRISKDNEVNRPSKFRIVSLDSSGKKVKANNIRLSIYRREYVYTSYREGREYRWKYEYKDVLVSERSVKKIDGEYEFSFTPMTYHTHKILVESDHKNVATEISFYPYSWDYESTMDLSDPGKLQVKLDKKMYKRGEKAKVTIGASGPGLLLLTVEKDKIIYKKVVEMKNNTTTIKIPVDKEFRPNFYVTASLLRHYSILNSDRPMREFGIAVGTVDQTENKLKVSLEMPDKVRPKRKLNAKIRVKNARGRAYVTVMAVDEGICQITGFKVPDPFKYFTRKRALGVTSYDTWSDIISDIKIMKNMLRVGGDEGEEAADRKHLSPVQIKRVEPVSLFSGIVKLSLTGTGNISFDIPQFNGTLRVMAVASADDRFGSSEEMVLVTDPIVLTSSLPRFIAPGDSFKIPVRVYNKTGKDGTFAVNLTVKGPVSLVGSGKKEIKIKDNREASLEFDALAKMDIGKVTFTITSSGNNEKTEETTDVPLRPSGQRTTAYESGRLAEGKSITFKIPSDFIGNPDLHVLIAKLPVIKYMGSLKYLVGYPYGCLEQTTSKAMPMLFVKDILNGVDPNEFARLGGDYFIREAIRKIERMLQVDQGFSFWPGGYYYNDYTTAYASHFLLEADKKGYTVSQTVLSQALHFLQKIARRKIEYKIRDINFYYNSLEEIVYALYILARHGKPDKETMIYLREHHYKKLYDHEKAMLAAAFAYIGNRSSARALMPKEIRIEENYDYYSWGGFYSSIRSVALALDALVAVEPGSRKIGELIDRLDRNMNRYGYWGNTQENAFALMALSKVLEKDRKSKFSGTLYVDGKKYERFSKDSFVLNKKSFAGRTVKIKMDPSSSGYYSFNANGYPLTPNRAAVSDILHVSKRYYTKTGGPVNLNDLRQGEVIIVELSLSSDERVDNVAIVDMLPAGFEIENTRLRMSGDIGWLPAKSDSDYTDIRDDRIIFFTSFSRYGAYEKKYYYAVRAVTIGKFTLPTVYA